MTNAPSLTPADRAATRRQHILWVLVKWGLFGLTLLFVGLYARKLWQDFDARSLRIRWVWLTLATLVSAAGWIPSVWFWRRLLAKLGATAPLLQVARAYYCGHPGKYVPGKAMVILIRTALLKPYGVPAAATAFTVTLETLTFMVAGVVTTVLLLPWLVASFGELETLAEFIHRPAMRVLLPVAALAGGLAGLTLLSRISRSLALRVQAALPSVGSIAQPISPGTFAGGLVAFLGAWWLQGAALGLTLQGLSPEPVAWSNLPLWTGTAAISTIGGFLAVFAPGGLGVREGLLMGILREQVGPHEAVAAAVILRGVTLASELLASVVLYAIAGRPGAEKTSSAAHS